MMRIKHAIAAATAAVKSGTILSEFHHCLLKDYADQCGFIDSLVNSMIVDAAQVEIPFHDA